MAIINAAQAVVKTVADPNAAYESMLPLWTKCEAVCSGERFVKDLDGIVSLGNMLIPFSPSMTQQQYDFFKAEAELPGISAQFSRMLIGGLLRKAPTVTFPKSIPEEARSWILNEIGQDGSNLVSFLDAALLEEVRTSRCWVYVDHPPLDDDIDEAIKEQVKPYPVLWRGKSVINWRTRTDIFGKSLLDRVIVRGYTEEFETNPFHPTLIDTVWVHELEDGFYQIRKYTKESPDASVPLVAGRIIHQQQKATFILKETITDIKKFGERLTFIPAWPLNGSIEVVEPVLMTIIDKELSLYNKISRRNHLLYGASTYTPIIFSDMTDEQFDEVVSAGLGSWIKLGSEDKAEVLKTPTEALADMDRAIASAIEEIAKLGIRMLSPETAQSGIALHLRNAAQTAQLGTLNSKISSTFKQVVAFMLEWRYGIAVNLADIDFTLSADFNPIPLGADWLRLATEWYQAGLVPRSVWLQILKQNDMLVSSYDDIAGQEEINQDEMLLPKGNSDYVNEVI